jgi:uncharacterized membrane protein
MAVSETNPESRNRDGMRCYLAGIFFPIIYLTAEPYKSSKFIRFHAFQSIEFTMVWVALTISTDSIRHQEGSISGLLSGLWLLFLVLWFVLMFKAYRGQMFKLPLLGSLAELWAK